MSRPASHSMDSSGKQRNDLWLPGQHVVSARYLFLRRYWRRPVTGSQTQTGGLGHSLLEKACHGSVLGRQTVPRPKLITIVLLAENVNAAGLFEVRVGAQFLLTSIARPARAKRGINGDLWRRFFDACDIRPQRITRVTLVRSSHLTAKGLELGCSTLFDMRGSTIANEMAEVLAFQANAVQAVDGMVWQVRMRIIEAKRWRSRGQHKHEFIPSARTGPQETRQQKRNEMLETLASAGYAIKRRWSTGESNWCARCGRDGSLQQWK